MRKCKMTEDKYVISSRCVKFIEAKALKRQEKGRVYLVGEV